MRPLARKIVLTQGVIILLIFGVSLFTWWQMVDASNRAERLQAEYHLGTNLEQLVAELRDIGRSRTYYFGEKKSGGEELARLQDSFYLSLVRIASTIDELALQSGPRADLAGLVDTLRRRLDEYQLRVGQQELAFLRDEELAYQRSGARAAELRQDMHDKTKDHRQQRQAAMTREINALGRRADRAAVLALVFCGVALVVGLRPRHSVVGTWRFDAIGFGTSGVSFQTDARWNCTQRRRRLVQVRLDFRRSGIRRRKAQGRRRGIPERNRGERWPQADPLPRPFRQPD